MLKLILPEKKYREQITALLDEWYATGEKIIPYSIRRLDYHDFDAYLEGFEQERQGLPGFVPATTLFGYDPERDVAVGAVNIRHQLNEALLRDGGHIGDGVRPSERRKGYATQMIALALEECRKLGIDRVLMTCDRDNVGSRKSIQNNGGLLENEIIGDGGEVHQRFWIAL